jgi:hypothetical protein
MKRGRYSAAQQIIRHSTGRAIIKKKYWTIRSRKRFCPFERINLIHPIFDTAASDNTIREKKRILNEGENFFFVRSIPKMKAGVLASVHKMSR